MSKLDDMVVIALGSNLPGRFDSCESLLEAALERFGSAGLTLYSRSRWWRSAAWPDPADPPFFNGVALVTTDLGPAEALAILHGLEDAFGRQRTAPNAPRTLDLDLIAHGRTVSAGPGLVTPHPRAHERLFVMGPLAEIAPEWKLPGSERNALSLAAEASLGRDATPI
jgi:2-amino-4-hydroxy-6-hydroxymethyldihydropteridine diphosphokinase